DGRAVTYHVQLRAGHDGHVPADWGRGRSRRIRLGLELALGALRHIVPQNREVVSRIRREVGQRDIVITLAARLIRLQIQIVGIGSVVKDGRRPSAGGPVNGGAGIRRRYVRAPGDGYVAVRISGVVIPIAVLLRRLLRLFLALFLGAVTRLRP